MIAGSHIDDVPEGDLAFRGVNARLRPAQLPGGYLGDGRNIRCTAGTVATRPGFGLKPWFNNPDNVGLLATSGLGLHGTGGGALVGTGGPVTHPAPVSGFQGWGVFPDSDDQLWIVYAAASRIYYTKPGNTGRPIGLPSGTSIAGQVVEFVPCNQNLLLFRGNDASPLQTSAVTSDFMAISQLDNDAENRDQNPDDGTSTIPNAEWALTLQQRLILPNHVLGAGILSASDYLNFTRYQPTLESFRANAGTSGRLIAAFPVPAPDDSPSSAILVFLDDPAIRIISGIIGDLSGLARTDVTSEYTAVNRKAIWAVGRDVWFVGGKGVRSVTQTTQGKWQGVDIPISLDLQPLFNRVNWNRSDLIRGIKVGNLSYISAPFDGSLTNNVIFIYDHEMQAWAGYDTGVNAQEFLLYNWMGVDRLVIWTTAGFVGLYGEGCRDATSGSTWSDIATACTLRGYSIRSHVGRERVKDITLQLKTWNPSYTLSAALDGANETQTIASGETRSRTRYDRPHTRARWDATNVNDDHGERFRQDYSVDLSAATYITNMDFDLFQESTEPWRCPAGTRGQAVSFTLTNTTGRIELCAVSVNRTEVDKGMGRKL